MDVSHQCHHERGPLCIGCTHFGFPFFFFIITLHCVIIISANLFFTIIMGVSLSYVVVLCWNTFGRCCVPPVAQLIGNTSCVKYYCNQYVTWTFVRHIGHIFHWILEEYGKDHSCCKQKIPNNINYN